MRTVLTKGSIPFLVLTFVAVVLVGTAGAHYQRLTYSHKAETGCTRPTDPVTVVFEGTGASYGRTLKAVEHNAAWRSDDRDEVPGHPFYHQFNDHSGCFKMDGERADASGPFNDRYHTRLREQRHPTDGQRFTFATPHHEQWIGKCSGVGSHAVDPGHQDDSQSGDNYYQGSYISGFDSGRDRLVNRFARNTRRHRVAYRWWGNTRSFKQCNGWRAGASGAVFAVSIGRVNW
jgi:hypothetical protein